MTIKPSTALRNEYNEISTICKTNGHPIFLTKNGEGDLVVMSIEAYSRREELLDLREKLLDAEMGVLNGGKLYSLGEVSSRLERIIDGKI